MRWTGMIQTGTASRASCISLLATWRCQSAYLPVISETAGKYLGPGRRDCTDAGWLKSLLQTLRANRARYELSSIQGYFDGIRDYLATRGSAAAGESFHNSWTELLAAMENRDASRWEAVLQELHRLAALKPMLQERDALLDRLRAVSPRWVARILAQGGRGEPLSLPAGWRRAWTWRRADSWLRRLRHEYDVEAMENRLQAARDEEARVLAELIAKEVWLHQLTRVTESQRRSLLAWVQAVRKIGKGCLEMKSFPQSWILLRPTLSSSGRHHPGGLHTAGRSGGPPS